MLLDHIATYIKQHHIPLNPSLIKQFIRLNIQPNPLQHKYNTTEDNTTQDNITEENITETLE